MANTRDTGYLRNLVAYDSSGNITLPANLTVTGTIVGYVPTSRTITINGTSYDLTANRSWNITSMIYPGAGIAVSTGSAWGTSITDNSANWNTAYTNRITSLTVTGNSGAATLVSNVLNIPTYTLVGLGGQAALSGTGFVKIAGTTISYDNSTYQVTSEKGVANGYASLNSSGQVPATQLPSFVDDVLEYANLAAFPATGESGKIYVTADTNKTYRWTGTVYVEISASPGSTDAVTEGSTNLYFTNARARAAISLTVTGSSGAATYSSATGVLNVPTYTLAGLGGEPTITAGTTAQYYRGDKSFQTLNTTAVAEGTNLYYTDARARAALSFVAGSGAYNSTTGVITIPTNTNQLTNGAGFITSYTETDTLATVTARGATTNTAVIINNNLAVNTSSPYNTSVYSLDINGGLLVKNTGRSASLTIINADPSAGGNNAFVVHTVGGTSSTSYVDIQGYYGASVAGSTVIRLNNAGGNVLIGSLIGTGTRMVVVDATGVLSTQSIPSGSAGVSSFNTRTGAVTLSSSDVTTALGFTPYNSTNPNGYISSYTETSTLANVTSRGASTSTMITLSGKLRMQSDLGLDAGYTLYFGKEESFGGSNIGGDDYGYITFDNNSTKYGSGGGETSVLRIGSSNDGPGSVSDSIAIEPTADLYLNPAGTIYRGTYTTKYTIWDSGNLTNLNQLTNGPGYITGESDTLATVTARGASTTAGITVNGNMDAQGIVYARANQTTAYTTAALWTQSFGSTLTGIAFHVSGVVGRMLHMNASTTDGNLYWNGTALVYNSGTWGINVTGSAGSVAWTNVTSRPTALSQFTNDSGFITGVTNISGTAGTATNWSGYYGGLLNWTTGNGTSTSGQNRMAARLYSFGRKINLDETFNYSANGISVYDNNGTGTVSISRISAPYSVSTSGYQVQIQHTGSGQNPGYGGFYFGTQTRSNATLACVFRAKLPSGYTINWASNSIGSGGNNYWATDNVGTGKYEDYVYIVRCGDSGTFSSSMFFYITGSPSPSSGSPLTWYISSATVYDVDDRDNTNTQGYVPLTSNNYTSYALPLSGGTLTGTLGLPGNALISVNGEPDTWGARLRTTTSTTNLGAGLKNIIWTGGGTSEGFAISGVGTGGASFEVRNDGIVWAKSTIYSAGNAVITTAGGSLSGTLSFAQPVGLSFANGQYIKDNSSGGLVIYSGAAVNINGTSVTMNSKVIVGTFPNSTTNTGEAWFGRAADRNQGTYTIQLGGNSASSRSFEVVDYAWSVVLFSVGSNGNINSSGTITASNFSGSSSGTNTGDQTTISGNAATATVLSTGRTNYKGVTDGVVVGELMWKNYGNSHTIFDASNGTAPNGTAKSRHTPDYLVNTTDGSNSWGVNPNLMGWNGSNTFGVKVDWSRYSESTGSVAWSNVSSRPTAVSSFTNDSGYLTSVGIANMTDVYRLFNNMGDSHGTRQDFNNAGQFGFRYIQGNINGPGTGASQFYGMTLGLGNDYTYGTYAMQMAIPRTAGDNYITYRTQEGGSWGSWRRISAGYADSAGSASTASTASTCSGNAATATNVAWSGVTSKPAGWLDTTNLIIDTAPGSTVNLVPSGFYQNYNGDGNPTGTWLNYINVRHSNPANGHGFQIGMTYYDSDLWFRSYQGSGSSNGWNRAISTANIGSQSVNYANYSGYSTSVELPGGNYIYFNGSGNHNVRMSESYGIVMNCVSHPWHVQVTGGSFMVGMNASGGSYGIGNGYFTGDVTAYYSDKRLKHDLKPIENAVSKITSLTGYIYKHNKLGEELLKENPNKVHAGLLAQEVQQVLPEVVTIAPFDLDGYDDFGNGISRSGEKYLTIKYERIVPLLIEGIKEQQKQIEELKKQIEYLVENK